MKLSIWKTGDYRATHTTKLFGSPESWPFLVATQAKIKDKNQVWTLGRTGNTWLFGVKVQGTDGFTRTEKWKVRPINTESGMVEALRACITKSGAIAGRSHKDAMRRLDAINGIVIQAIADHEKLAR